MFCQTMDVFTPVQDEICGSAVQDGCTHSARQCACWSAHYTSLTSKIPLLESMSFSPRHPISTVKLLEGVFWSHLLSMPFSLTSKIQLYFLHMEKRP